MYTKEQRRYSNAENGNLASRGTFVIGKRNSFLASDPDVRENAHHRLFFKYALSGVRHGPI